MCLPPQFRGFDESGGISSSRYFTSPTADWHASVAARVSVLKPPGGGETVLVAAPSQEQGMQLSPSYKQQQQQQPAAASSSSAVQLKGLDDSEPQPPAGSASAYLGYPQQQAAFQPEQEAPPFAGRPIRLSVRLSPDGAVLADPDPCLCAGMPLLPCTDVECCCGGTGLGCFVPGRRTYHDSLAELYGEFTFQEALWACTAAPLLSTLIFCLPVVRLRACQPPASAYFPLVMSTWFPTTQQVTRSPVSA